MQNAILLRYANS